MKVTQEHKLNQDDILDMVRAYDDAISGLPYDEQEQIFANLPKRVQRAVIRRDSKVGAF